MTGTARRLESGLRGRLPRYGWRQLGGDLAGGSIAALIALPYGLALATLIGLPPAFGIFTSVLTGPLTALLGSNGVLIGGTASVTVPFLSAAVAEQGVGGAAKVTILAAIFLMVFSMLRLGRYVSMIPLTVVSGFSCGIGMMMVITQLKTILGLPKPPGEAWSNSMLAQLGQVFSQLSFFQRETFFLGLIVVLVAFLAARRWDRIPAPLLGVIAACLISASLGWHTGKVGSVTFEVPPLAAFSWKPSEAATVLPAALGLAAVSAANLLITSRVVYHFAGSHRAFKKAEADRELGAYGIANLVAGLFGAPMSVGIPARSLANVKCGGTTRASNIFHALILAFILWAGSDLIAVIPTAALAGVTAYVGLCLLEWSTWRRLPRMRKLDASAFLATALATQMVNAVAAVLLGCSFYFLAWLRHKLNEPAPANSLTPQTSPSQSSRTN
ncbi:MAG: SulP family inorganic anion transporter [Bryobacterales bacterium]|nr:SulP family inorganic anion transporter [Bryobacterales bacterium]